MEITGWPDCLAEDQRARLTGPRAGLTPLAAARLVKRMHGLEIAGGRLSARGRLPPNTALPAVPRSERNTARRSRPAPWLPEVDDTGRFSLTPRVIAERQARWLAADVVIDPFCGCGGNAAAFARSGARVFALEADPARAAMARRNAAALGVAARVSVRVGIWQRHLSALLRQHPSAGVFLDPPWGGRDWSRTRLSWSDLIPEADRLGRLLISVDTVLLKAPRTFDPTTLPQRPGDWRVRLELGEGRVVKMLSIRSAN